MCQQTFAARGAGQAEACARFLSHDRSSYLRVRQRWMFVHYMLASRDRNKGKAPLAALLG